MKNRGTRRHHEYRAKRKAQKNYNSCIKDLSAAEQRDLEGKIDKLKKVCASPYSEDTDRKLGKKTLQERRHDITMEEELQ